jgi:phosphatidylserine/phosphatidylglycerophosphate/cardiolipin synthase-like enzyme
VRVISHDGLRDAATLEAFLALVDGARSHVYVINGFPLLLEIQHALLRALRRGVRVRTLFGNLTPTHAGIPFGGPWSSARLAATELVHSRQDLLVQHGAEAYRLVVPEQPGWEPGLGSVGPHVHAKALTADGEACAVGSANLDITASYWESEVLLVVEDPSVTRAVEARVDQLMAGSVRLDRDDPEWQATALRRQWMRRWPGVLSV